MTQRTPIRHHSRLAATTLLVAAMVAAIVVTRTAGAQPSDGTHITQVSVEHRDDDSSVIAIVFDGPITGHRWSHIHGEKPRAVLRIVGIVEAYRPYEVAIEDGRVRRVRIGHHPEFDPPEEHLVFDLIDNGVAITRVEKQDRRLLVVLERIEASGGPRSSAPNDPKPTALAPTPTPTMTPTMTPTATVTPTPTPRLAATATAAPTSPTAPTSAPSTAKPAIPTNPPRVVTPDRRTATSPHAPEDFFGPLLTELVISHREDGSTLVRVTADGPIEGSDVRFFAMRASPPRNLLVIPGAGLPGEDALLPVRDGLLCEIGVVFTEDGGTSRIELTFYLASSEVTFEQAGVKGAHAVILLRPPADPQAPLGCKIESRMRSRTWRFVATGPPQEAPIGVQ